MNEKQNQKMTRNVPMYVIIFRGSGRRFLSNYSKLIREIRRNYLDRSHKDFLDENPDCS